MNPTRTTPPSHASAVTTSRSRRPGHPVSVPLAGSGATAPAGSATPVPDADPVDRLQGIRARLAALAPLLQDEPARRLDAVLREVEALVEQLGRRRTGESGEAGPPSRAVQTPAVQGLGIHEVPAPGHPRQSPAAPTTHAPTTRHRPPALPCGPDYPLLPVHRAS